MKLSNKEIQPYRIWYEYLQTALNNKSFSNKVNKNYYKDWHLNLVKKQKFNQWIKSHEHLFTQSDNSEIKLFEGKRTPNTILVEIPVSFNVQRIQKEIGKAVKGKVAKTQTNQRFKIQTNRPLQTAPLDYFLWAYEFKQSGKYKLKEVWQALTRRLYSEELAFGFKRDLSIKIHKPRSLAKVIIREGTSEDEKYFSEEHRSRK